MSIPRKNPFCLEAALWYHCTLHCVRRVFLCSRDKLSGKNFEHRRRWMEDRIHELACVFALDLLRGLSSSPLNLGASKRQAEVFPLLLGRFAVCERSFFVRGQPSSS